MKREELLTSTEYWVAKTQIDLFNNVNDYLKENGLSRLDLAKKLGVTKGYISQVLNGTCDHRLSNIYKLSLAIGKVPTLKLQNIQTVLEDDKNDLIRVAVEYTVPNHKLDYNGQSPIYQMYTDTLKYTCDGSK